MIPEAVRAMINQAIGTEGVIGLSRWFEKMESVFYISGCAVENQVKFATYTMLDAALTWWNGHLRTLGHDAAYVMTWETLKKKMTDKYCPRGEIKKLKIELWNLKDKVDKYISGLPDNIHGNVMFARPKTLDEAIELANDLMDQKLRTYAERQTENKRKFDNNNQAQQIPKRQNVDQSYAVRTGERKEYAGCVPTPFIVFPTSPIVQTQITPQKPTPCHLGNPLYPHWWKKFGSKINSKDHMDLV
nr:hypothetical protein [Tanacetum cinerariifolium]